MFASCVVRAEVEDGEPELEAIVVERRQQLSERNNNKSKLDSTLAVD